MIKKEKGHKRKSWWSQCDVRTKQFVVQRQKLWP